MGELTTVFCCMLAVPTALSLLNTRFVSANVFDDKNVLERITALEVQQRESQIEITILRKIISEQQSTINIQAEKIKKLELESRVHNTKAHENTKRNDESRTLFDTQHVGGILSEHILAHDQSNESQYTNVKDTFEEYIKEAHISNVDCEKCIKRKTGISNKQAQYVGIAFTAYLDHDLDLGDRQTIKFNRIIANEGNDYNPNTGVFTCSEAGVYMFFFAIGNRDQKLCWIELVVNKVNVVDAAVDTLHEGQDLQGGNMAVIRLKHGDNVWIDSIGAGAHVEGSDNLRISSFSGIYLFP